jgi:hypothetical protein
LPLFAIADAVEKIKDGTIAGYVYDPSSARLVERGGRGGWAGFSEDGARS